MKEIDIEMLSKEAEDIQKYLEMDKTDWPVTELVTSLATINVYLARTGEMLADAKYVQDQKTQAIYTEFSKTILKMPATVATRFIGSMVADENYLVNWLDRLNRTLVHQGDNIRTQVSFEKENLKLTRTGY